MWIINFYIWGMLFTLFLIILAVAYAIIDFFLLHGLKTLKTENAPQASPSELPFVNILLCARNEEQNIEKTIRSILAQDYPADKWKLLIADDRSTDQTPAIIERFQQENPQHIDSIRINSVPDGHSPKKNALTQLHKKVDAEVVITTDADCRVPISWLRSMCVLLSKEGSADMVIGHAHYTKNYSISSALWGLQSLDFFSHGVVAAGSVGMGLPINSNANNLAYRKSCFDSVRGYENLEQIVSGDDDLLLHKFISRDFRIHYNINPESYVETDPQTTYKGVWEQRKRWASKTIYYTRPVVLMLGTIFLFYLLISGLMISSLIFEGNFWPGFILLVWKSVLDYLVMDEGARIFKKGELLKWYIPMAALHPFLIVGAVLWGYFSGFNWKDKQTSGSKA
jgi:cellulose synthase/poly-beta-1,6-N-acetylglucosamine synthase-like glycosyltransferase